MPIEALSNRDDEIARLDGEVQRLSKDQCEANHQKKVLNQKIQSLESSLKDEKSVSSKLRAELNKTKNKINNSTNNITQKATDKQPTQKDDLDCNAISSHLVLPYKGK